MYAKTTVNELCTPPAYGRPIRVLEFELAETGYTYNVGDALGIHPSNPADHVGKFLQFYGLNPNVVVSILPVGDAAPLPIPPSITIGHLFERYLDVFSRPRKLFFRQLAQFATSATERANLELLASKEGEDKLKDYLKDWPGYSDVLADFKSARPTLDFLVDMIPTIKPRLYSVASSPKFVGTKVQLIIGIPTEISRCRGKIKGGGLATSWLPTVPEGAIVPVMVHEGSLRPPTDSTAPMLLCGLGTGLAPMRALLQDRMTDKKAGKEVGYTLLYQACRTRADNGGDFILQKELDEWKAARVLHRHIGAFSHMVKDRFETIDMLVNEHPEDAWSVLKLPNAHYYYCGLAAFNIPGKIEEALTKACMTAGRLTKEAAAAHIEKMKAEQRWRVEAF
eukprot:TRINITY_DN551_c0_g1_i2.p1 TRINITY_DN551_c0_g1~~TRINITY_DN551_c0_g1_i2.p1  ORF type:complete len:394 (-),score=121.87 TRINITY_DN551_c0_g1_i2:93-1274(-)